MQMSGASVQPAESLEESQETNVVMMASAGSGTEKLTGQSDPMIPEEDFSAGIERFSHLSSDLTEVLLDLSRIVRNSAERLKEIQSAVEEKKSELTRLQAQIESERRAYEEERMLRIEQEKEYAENLILQRQREEEEYRRVWSSEKARAQQQLEEDLRLIQEENRLKQEIAERELLQREMALKEKELEWVQLTQELDEFMSRLSKRVQPRP